MWDNYIRDNKSKVALFVVIILVAFLSLVVFLFFKPARDFLKNFVPTGGGSSVLNQAKGGMFNIAPTVNLPKKTTGQNVAPVSQATMSVSNFPVITLDDPDLNGLETTFKKIRQAMLEENYFLLDKYYSSATLADFASSGGRRIVKIYLKDMTFGNIRKISKEKLIVAVSSVEMSGHTETADTIFVRERDGWKMGIVETEEYFK